ncbi:MAG: arsenate reductase (glutaredoxin) [Paracoccus sp. (in: a-proteobacteria)]|nr:arsenate reductase (glutaredoxin) [Paracoccus sp. (in: a-proteobacteria)]
MSISIWHKPTCSTSRRALAMVRAAGHDPDIRDYIANPPDAAELARVAALVGGPATLIRRKEPLFRDMNLKDADDAALLAAMLAHPVLIERPVVLRDGKAVLGRPAEAIEALL